MNNARLLACKRADKVLWGYLCNLRLAVALPYSYNSIFKAANVP